MNVVGSARRHAYTSPADSPPYSLQTDARTHSHMQTYLCCLSSPADTQIDLTMGPSALNQAVVSVRVGDFPGRRRVGKRTNTPFSHIPPHPFFPIPVINNFFSTRLGPARTRAAGSTEQARSGYYSGPGVYFPRGAGVTLPRLPVASRNQTPNSNKLVPHSGRCV